MMEDVRVMLFHQPHPRFDAIHWPSWSPSDEATLCFILQDGHILLMEKKRGLGAGKVNGPGGRIEPGESPLECAIRETREELGVTPLHPHPRGELRFQFVDGYSLRAHLFLSHGCEGEPIETEEAVPLWTPLDRIPYARMWADDLLWLPHLLEGRHIDASFLLEGDSLLGWHVLTHGGA